VSKYGAVRTTVDGITFASKAEASRYTQLKLLAKAGHISSLRLQPRYPLTINGTVVGTYVADFAFLDERTGKLVVEDVKGYATPVYKLKRRLVKALYGIEITEVAA
jgi:hypothetical protein